nr:DUF6602 domain-containing protein [Paenibacillus monticola]
MDQMLLNEMELSSMHPGLTGSYREGAWLKFFRGIIPYKYQLAQGVIIIDSERNVSKEVDIAVYDESYTPYVFQYNSLKYIPIEAVAMVIECKSKNYNPEDLKKWSKKIEKLKTKASGVARMVQGYAIGENNRTQSGTRPIRVLVSMKERVNEESMLNSADSLSGYFDFIVEEQKSSSKSSLKSTSFRTIVANEDRTLGWWGEALNNVGGKTKELNLHLLHMDQNLNKTSLALKYPELSFSDDLKLSNTLKDLRIEGNPLLSLNLQINQLLMLLNNPMLFPHFAYANAFKEALKERKNADTSTIENSEKKER